MADMVAGEKFAAILADPPWHFATRGRTGPRHAANHYNTMSLADIAALEIPAADDCALFLWAIDPMLPAALDLIKAWGFTYKTVAFTWAKKNRRSDGWFTGMGYWTRSNPEMCLLATRGRPQRLAKDVRQLVVARRREHSRKPDCVHGRIERLVAGPYLEMFARQRRAGWAAWGNQPDKFTDATDEWAAP